jgi:hypothetical protein
VRLHDTSVGDTIAAMSSLRPDAFRLALDTLRQRREAQARQAVDIEDRDPLLGPE